VRRWTGTPSHLSGVQNHRKARAICSGGVVMRKSDVSCSMPNAMAPTEQPRERLKRLTVTKRNLNSTYLHRGQP
jgi:hypothetical protein